MKNLMNPYQAFQLAKDSFAQLHPASRPDSLVRRGDVIIARRLYTAWALDPKRAAQWTAWKRWAKNDWVETIVTAIPEAKILSVEIDEKRNVRVKFSLIDDDFCHFLRDTRDFDACPTDLNNF